MVFSFFNNLFNRNKTGTTAKKIYTPTFWEDDYCQIEIVPVANKPFVEKQLIELEEFTGKHYIEYGFTDVFQTGPMPFLTLNEEFRVDALESVILSHGLQKVVQIIIPQGTVVQLQNNQTYAYGCDNYTIFIEAKQEFVKTIWLTSVGKSSQTEFDNLFNLLYDMGECYEMLLIDWRMMAAVELANRKAIREYLPELMIVQ